MDTESYPNDPRPAIRHAFGENRAATDPKLILPVEDERIVARDLQLRLLRLGYRVPVVASSRQEALQLSEEFKPDLVIMDITLDGSPDGIQAAREIRSRYNVPVIYLTAHSDSDTLEQAKLTEPYGYILKPFEDRELLATIETALHKHTAETQVRLAERWLDATLRSIGDGVITTGENGRINFMNRIAEELTGWTAAEAAGHDLFSVLHFPGEDAADAARRLLAKVRSEGVPSGLDEPTLLVSKDGRRRLVADSLAPIVDQSGRNTGLVFVFRDVTEREDSQREIRARSRQQTAANRIAQRALAGLDLQQLMDETCELVCGLLDVEFCEILELLPGGQRLLLRAGSGWREGAVGEVILEREASHAAFVLESVGPSLVGDFRNELRFETSPLLREHAAVSGVSVLIGLRDKPYGVLGAYSRRRRTFTGNEVDFLQALAYTLRSAVDRKRAEMELHESHGLLDAVFTAQTDGVLVSNTEGIIVRTNPAATAFFGFDGTGMHLRELVDRLGIEGGLPGSVTMRALAGETRINVEQVAGARIIETSSAPMRDASGLIIGAVTISRDITERKRAEERLRESQRLESIAVLAGGIAHDFNNLLGVMMGNASLALEQGAAPDNMHSILAATDRAAELTRQLVAYAGKGRYVSEMIDLNAIVSSAQDMLRAAIPKTVTLDLDLARNLPALEADPGQIRQILIDLTLNAGEAIPRNSTGHVRISTGTSSVAPELASRQAPVFNVTSGEFVVLEVRDTGAGIEENIRSRIFEPFFTTKFTGRGLGLAAVQGLARAYRGFVEVDSAVGAGTTVRVFLPASQMGIHRAYNPAAASATAPVPGTVMVVDDDEMLRNMAGALLEGCGYQVMQAPNGDQALELLASSPVKPAVILLDLTMPLLGGEEILSTLEAQYPGVKVILSSGYNEEDLQPSLRSGVVAGFLRKPYSRDGLAAKMKQAMSA